MKCWLIAVAISLASMAFVLLVSIMLPPRTAAASLFSLTLMLLACLRWRSIRRTMLVIVLALSAFATLSPQTSAMETTQ